MGKETLRRLCDEIGWSYAVFWRPIRQQNQMHLVWEDAAVRSSEERVGELVYKTLAPQVHVVGDGIVGQAGLTGNHQWVILDGLSEVGSLPKGLTEMSQQLLAGIQTIAVIPVLPRGVVQLGSTQMVMENVGFINHVRSLFEQLLYVPRDLVTDVAEKSLSRSTNQNISVGASDPGSHSGYFGPCLSRFSSVDSSTCPSQLLKHHPPRSVSQHFLPLSSSSGKNKMPVNSSEVTSSKVDSTTVTPYNFPPPTVEVIQPISYHKSDSVGAQIVFSNSGLTSTTDQLLSIPSSQGSANKHVPNSKSPELTFEGCLFSSSQTDSVSVLPFSGRHSLTNSNSLGPFQKNLSNLGRCSSFPGSTSGSLKSQHPNSPSIEGAQMQDSAGHSNRIGMLSRHSQTMCSTSTQNSQPVPTEGKPIKDGTLFQTLDFKTTQLEDHLPSYESLLGIAEVDWLSSSSPVQGSSRTVNTNSRESHASGPSSQNINGIETSEYMQSGYDLFDLLGVSSKALGFHDAIIHGNEHLQDASEDVSTCMTQLDMGPVLSAPNQEIYCSEMFTESPPDQLLDAVVAQMKSSAKDGNLSCETTVTNISTIQTNLATRAWEDSSVKVHPECVDRSPMTVTPEASCSASVLSRRSMDKTARCSKQDADYESQISLWAQNGQKTSHDSFSATDGKQLDEVGKLNKKRSRSGENPRPRPKDRQMIQDRVKELREIVPNGAKCSIDALLEKTIKHMLFLQSVTKHADKLKEVGEPKIVSKEGGLLLKDNFEGGATWAFEVGTQSMTCPIIVEDLNPPRQLLVEMLCEEQGLFLEIADLIRGMGLTILKGVMEARNSTVWARFAVEANRDVARMEIFLSLVRLLEPNAGSSMAPQGVEKLSIPRNIFNSAPSVPATGFADHFR